MNKTKEKQAKNNKENISEGKCCHCNGLGRILRKDEKGRLFVRDCKCFINALSKERFEKTEIANKTNYTFKDYIVTEDWQQQILNKAKEYVKNYKENWFYIGGQVGAGKTHICTAILRNIGELNNISYTYIKCDEELEKLKQLAYENQDEYYKILDRLKNVGMLFIDDFFKKEPSKSDIAKMFDIINFRYLNDKVCIFSSEHILINILNIDEAIGSRIFEKAKKFNIAIDKDLSKNYRLK